METRSESERDVDRLLYTFYFRRLAEITQVASYEAWGPVRTPSGADALQHNRLTHSLKVAQVGSRMAAYLLADAENSRGIETAGGMDPSVLEAAGRAHDLGHPPFGHIGEEVLDEIARQHGLADGFEGNAQTFRIVASLARRYSQEPSQSEPIGLNLTQATLAACVKYPWSRGLKGKKFYKFGYLEPDAKAFDDLVKPMLPAPMTPTLEASLMDWADDVSYASHDLEDFAIDGSVPLSLLAHENRGTQHDPHYVAVAQDEMQAFWAYATARLNQYGHVPHQDALVQFQRMATNFPRRRANGSRKSAAYYGALSSRIIQTATAATSVNLDGSLDVDPGVRSLVDVLKQLTWYYVIDTPRLVAAQRGQRKRLRAVTDDFIQWALFAFRQSEQTPWGERRDISADAQVANIGALPPLLRDMIQSLTTANKRRGAYVDEYEKNVVRGVIDFVASLRETEVDDYYRILIG